MNKSFLSFLFCLAIAINLQSQDLGKIYFGIKGGYNYVFSNFTASETTPQSGGYVGLMLKIPFENRLHFAPQFDLNYRGMKAKTLVKNTYSKVTEIQARIMPLIQIDFKKPSQKENTLFVHFGPSLGFGLSGNQTKQDDGNTPISGKLKYSYSQYGRYDASWHTGFGYETTKGFRLVVDYAYGLGNMINTDEAPKLKFQAISAGLAYWFGKK